MKTKWWTCLPCKHTFLNKDDICPKCKAQAESTSKLIRRRLEEEISEVVIEATLL